jgi:hypothetical protein
MYFYLEPHTLIDVIKAKPKLLNLRKATITWSTNIEDSFFQYDPSLTRLQDYFVQHKNIEHVMKSNNIQYTKCHLHMMFQVVLQMHMCIH